MRSHAIDIWAGWFDQPAAYRAAIPSLTGHRFNACGAIDAGRCSAMTGLFSQLCPGLGG